MNDQFKIVFQTDGSKAQCPPNPEFPAGVDIDVTVDHDGCKFDLPYPAVSVGVWIVTCRLCGLKVGITAAGRPDDPRSARVPCKIVGSA